MTEALRVLGGRYELGQTLGRGGMAEVRRARDVRLGRDVAVKQLRIDLASDPTFQERFRREAQAAAGLNHPNIVAVYDTGEEADPATGIHVPYIVMELVEGRTLRDLLRTGRQIQPEKALTFAQGVLEALSYSHRAGIVHRDIKPANVMLTPDGTVKVMDFGIARAVADTSATMTQTAAVIGTAQYLSPEQARGETVDARSDIYSAGCLLYELLTGRPPFQGDSPVSVAYQHVREAPVPPSHLDALVTPAMDAIVLKALAKDPADRYQTAAAMRADIGRLLAGQEVLAKPPLEPVVPTAIAPSETTQVLATEDTGHGMRAIEPPRNRHVGLIAFLAALVVLAAGVAAFMVWRSSNADLVSVPSVTRRLQVDAQRMLEDAKLVARVVEVPGPDDQTKGLVIAQDPQAGAQVPAGSTVTLSVNSGPSKATIPDVTGQKIDSAVQQLRDLGFTNVTPTPDPSEPLDAEAKTVTKVNPTIGTSVTIETPITVYYATGKSDVPNLFGLTRQAATDTANRAGFTNLKFSEDESTATPGTVIKQDPPVPSNVLRTTQIKIIIAKPPSPPTSSPSPTPDETPASPGPTG
jgi:serine/threonine-protein kinase